MGQIGDLLRDWRRINVSFTRAKRKLVIFGSRSTLQSDRLLADFFKLMEGKGWIYTLPKGAADRHPSPTIAQTPIMDSSKMRDSKIGTRILEGKPLLKEALASESNTTAFHRS